MTDVVCMEGTSFQALIKLKMELVNMFFKDFV